MLLPLLIIDPHSAVGGTAPSPRKESPAISIQFIQSEDEPKQLGDIAASLLPAAYCSALSQAVGETITNMPVQTDTVYKLTEKLKNPQ